MNEASRILTAAKAVEMRTNKSDVLDLARKFSYGKQAGTNNMVDEHAKAIQLNLRITNLTDNLHTVCLAGLTSSFNPTIFPDIAALKAALSATGVLKDGVIVNDGSGKELKAELTDSGLNLDQFIKYIANNPTRLVGLSMVSRNATTGAGDSQNYDLKLKTHWVSPFDVPTKKELNLRPLVVTGANFTQERLNVNFVEQAFPVILSAEHGFSIQIAKNTELTITLFIGAQDSRPQLFWRDIKAADDVIRPELIRMK